MWGAPNPRPSAVRSGDAGIVSPQKEHIRQDVASKITFRPQDKSLGGAPEVGEPRGTQRMRAQLALSAALSALWASASSRHKRHANSKKALSPPPLATFCLAVGVKSEQGIPRCVVRTFG